MNRPVYFVGGNKGGVGKSLIVKGIVDRLFARGDGVIVVEADMQNPDVWTACQGLATTVKVDLDRADGWMRLVDACDEHPRYPVVVNTAPGLNRGARAHGNLLGGALAELDRRLIVFWPLGKDDKGIGMLEEFMLLLPEAEFHPMRNLFFGNIDEFEYDQSELRKAVESAGWLSLTFPRLAGAITDQIERCGGAVDCGWAERPLGARREVSRWRQGIDEILIAVDEWPDRMNSKAVDTAPRKAVAGAEAKQRTTSENKSPELAMIASPARTLEQAEIDESRNGTSHIFEEGTSDVVQLLESDTPKTEEIETPPEEQTVNPALEDPPKMESFEAEQESRRMEEEFFGLTCRLKGIEAQIRIHDSMKPSAGYHTTMSEDQAARMLPSWQARMDELSREEADLSRPLKSLLDRMETEGPRVGSDLVNTARRLIDLMDARDADPVEPVEKAPAVVQATKSQATFNKALALEDI